MRRRKRTAAWVRTNARAFVVAGADRVAARRRPGGHPAIATASHTRVPAAPGTGGPPTSGTKTLVARMLALGTRMPRLGASNALLGASNASLGTSNASLTASMPRLVT